MPGKTALLVHFNDLRITDNQPLVESAAFFDAVYPLVVIDPAVLKQQYFGIPKFSARRLDWYLKAVKDLRHSYRLLGGDLLIRLGKTDEVVSQLVSELGITAVYGQHAKTTEELALRRDIETVVGDIPCHWRWTDVLIAPNQLPMSGGSFPRSFSSFRKKFEARCTVPTPLDPPVSLSKPPIEPGDLPNLEALGFDSQLLDVRSPIATLGFGETGAWQQVENYFWRGDHLKSYKHTRNGMTDWSDSSKLSPYLALGLISPRSIYHQILNYEQERVANQSTYWLRFELLWREYFHALGLFMGNRLFHQTGVRQRPLPWLQDVEVFERWTTGRTGCPIVDACMRELAETGYSSNRARQIAASFLVKYLGIDWRWGAAWFEYHLLDYDPCSNWGNWQYLAGVGTDTKDRVFSMKKHAQFYDSEAIFVKRWLPEFRGEPAESLIAQNPWGPEDWETQSTIRQTPQWQEQSGHHPL